MSWTPKFTCLKCTDCGAEYPPDSLMNLCPVDQRPVEIQIDLERLKSEQANAAWYNPQRKDMWRFGGLLALDVNDSEDLPNIVSLGEGHTPLLNYDDHPDAKKGGFSLARKTENISMLQIIEAINGYMNEKANMAVQTDNAHFALMMDQACLRAISGAREIYEETKLSDILVK